MRRLLYVLPFLLASAPVVAQADELPTFRISIKNHRFQPAELNVPADTRIMLQVKNEDATPEEFESQDLDIEKIIPANSEGTVYVRPMGAGSYHFFGDFNQATAQGNLIVK